MNAMGYERNATNKAAPAGLSTVQEESGESESRHQLSGHHLPDRRGNQHLNGEPAHPSPIAPRQPPPPPSSRPLELQSPLAAPVRSSSGVAAMSAEVPAAAPNFRPDYVSTSTNVHESIALMRVGGAISSGGGETGGGGDVNRSLLRGDPRTNDIEGFQRDLSGEDQDAANNTRAGKKNVSFTNNVTIYEALSREAEEAHSNQRNGAAADSTLHHMMGGGGHNNRSVLGGNATLVDLMMKEGGFGGDVGRGVNGRPNELVEYTKTTLGPMKTTDGQMELHRSIMSRQQQEECMSPLPLLPQSAISSSIQQGRVWNLPDAVWNAAKNANLEDSLHTVQDPTVMSTASSKQPVSESDATNWEDPPEVAAAKEKRKAPPPDFDMAKDKYSWVHVKTYPIEGLPQDVSHSDLSIDDDVTLVTDVENNRVLRFQHFKHKVHFASDFNFLTPRYVLCLPDRRVVVLDSKGLHVFSSRGKHLDTLFKDRSDRFRGLSYQSDYRRLVTIDKRKNDDLASVAFIDFDVHKIVANRIELEYTRGKPESKVRFLRCRGDTVVSTDLGLGAFYITDLKKAKTDVVCSERLKVAMGVEIDPAGNILVASQCHGKIEVFSPAGDHVRTLSFDKLQGPSGMHIHGRFIFVVDSKAKSLMQYTVAEKD